MSEKPEAAALPWVVDAFLPFTLTGRAEGALKNLCGRKDTEREETLVYRDFCAAALAASISAPIPRKGCLSPPGGSFLRLAALFFFSLFFFSPAFLAYSRNGIWAQLGQKTRLTGTKNTSDWDKKHV